MADVERTERVIALQRSTVGNEKLVAENPLEKTDCWLVGGLIRVADAANEEIFKHFCSEMELPRAWWKGLSLFGACTFGPAFLVLWKPKFCLRAAEADLVE